MQSRGVKKIALFVPSLRGGGAERVTLNLARGFIDLGYEVDMVLASAEGPLLPYLPTEAKLIDFGCHRVSRSMPGLIAYLRRERPDVMLCVMEHTSIVALWAAKLAAVNTRIVVTVHNTLSRASKHAPLLRGRIMPFFVRAFYPWAYCTVVVSEAAKKDLLHSGGLNPERVKVILNPVVTPDLFQAAEKAVEHPWFSEGQPPVILAVGRLTEQKDFTTLLKAFARVRDKCKCRLIIAGEGEERSALEKTITDLGIADDVDLHGYVDNPYAYMAHASVFVLSSAWEGLPTVLIEAMAIGLPVVSTDCPSGPKEILHNGKYGILVPVGDIDAIAQGVIHYLQNPPMKNNTSDAWSAYELEAVTQQYLDVFFEDKSD